MQVVFFNALSNRVELHPPSKHICPNAEAPITFLSSTASQSNTNILEKINIKNI
jgi:hypothetical protein